MRTLNSLCPVLARGEEGGDEMSGVQEGRSKFVGNSGCECSGRLPQEILHREETASESVPCEVHLIIN